MRSSFVRTITAQKDLREMCRRLWFQKSRGVPNRARKRKCASSMKSGAIWTHLSCSTPMRSLILRVLLQSIGSFSWWKSKKSAVSLYSVKRHFLLSCNCYSSPSSNNNFASESARLVTERNFL